MERYDLEALYHDEIAINIPVIQSSLVMRFVNNDFQENKEPTIGGQLPPLRIVLKPIEILTRLIML